MRRLVVVAVAALVLAGGCSAVRDLGATHCPASRKLLPQGAADDKGVSLAFHLDDGTATTLGYSVHLRRLDCRDPLPQAFGAAVRAALR